MLDTRQQENLLYDLFEAYIILKRGKTNKKTIMDFEMNNEKEIMKLHKDLIYNTYNISSYTCFLIYDPVPREIFAPHIRDRIVHHFIYKQLNPILEDIFLDNSYACRIGKGTHYAIHQTKKMIRSVSDNYTQESRISKNDITSYFMSIDKKILLNLIEQILKDNESKLKYPIQRLESILQTIINHDPIKNYFRIGKQTSRNTFPKHKSLFASKPLTGLPLGNLTSQIFANIYLYQLDVFVTETLGIKHYGRYMDDFILMHTDKYYLQNCLKKIDFFLTNTLKLTLHPNKKYFQPIKHGVTFCGVKIKPYYITPRRRTIGRRKKKLQKRKDHPPNNYNEREQFRSIYNSYLGMMKHRSSYRLRKSMLGLFLN